MPTPRNHPHRAVRAAFGVVCRYPAWRRAARTSPAAGLLILRDDEPGEPERTLSPFRYHYQHRAEIEAVVHGAACGAAFDTRCASIGAIIATDRTLGGLCDFVEANAPNPINLVRLKAPVPDSGRTTS
jgi:hypothetical protein